MLLTGVPTAEFHRPIGRVRQIEDRLPISYSDFWRTAHTRCRFRYRLDEAALIARIGEMAAALPDLLSDEVRRARGVGLNHPVLDRLTDVLTARAQTIEHLVAGG